MWRRWGMEFDRKGRLIQRGRWWECFPVSLWGKLAKATEQSHLIGGSVFVRKYENQELQRRSAKGYPGHHGRIQLRKLSCMGVLWIWTCHGSQQPWKVGRLPVYPVSCPENWGLERLANTPRLDCSWHSHPVFLTASCNPCRSSAQEPGGWALWSAESESVLCWLRITKLFSLQYLLYKCMAQTGCRSSAWDWDTEA